MRGKEKGGQIRLSLFMPAIGIVGGMGPWVDPLLLRKLLEYQAALGMRRDQEALPVLLAQYPELIEDRTEYLVSLESGAPRENPALNAARIARMLAGQGACVLGIPCNTFHAPPIFSRFEDELRDLEGVEIVHMVRATLAGITARRIGILSTNGTYLHRIYSGPIAERGLEPVTLPFESPAGSGPSQNDVHQAITNPDWGIKSGREAQRGYPTARAVLTAAAQRLRQLGAEVIILGCTEIPLALEPADVPGTPLVDPLEALARALVEACRRRRAS